MKTSNVDLIKEFEGFRAESYQCEAGVWTVGYGSTQYGQARPVKQGDRVDEQTAEQMLLDDVRHFEVCLSKLVKLPLRQNQFDALISFIYNIGCGAFERSTMLKKINKDPNDPTILNEFLRWNKINGGVSNGLTKRRQKEADLYGQTN